MKLTKEEIKRVLRKILFWKREHKKKEENYVSVMDQIKIEETLNILSVPDSTQVENEKLTIKERYDQIPQSEKAKMMFRILKRERLNKEKQSETPPFDNEQMLLHFLDKCEEVELKFSKELISTEENLNIIFHNQVMAIEPGIVVSAFAYEELNNTYRLEAKTLIGEIMLRVGYTHVSEALIIDFLKEVIKEKKLQIEKEAFKRKIVWLKK